jgi:hypothetical protein
LLCYFSKRPDLGGIQMCTFQTPSKLVSPWGSTGGLACYHTFRC